MEQRHWIEKTYLKGHPDRESGDHALGKALWSPHQAKNGADLYRLMREVKKGDIVIHLVDNRRIEGVSVADGVLDNTFVGLPGTSYEGRPCYRIGLSGFAKLDPVLERADWLDDETYRVELKKIHADHNGLVFSRNLELNQGHYLTEAPAELVRFLDRAYRAKSGQDLPYVRLMSDESPGTRNKGQLEITSLIDGIAGQGFVFEPWQVAAYATALRTKPFVILAGVSGTGKSKLPRLVSEATGGESTLIPVRPDWTDSSDILGYCSLDGKFRPGRFLEFVREATDHPEKHFVCIIDEMNLARVEHYFAEILSRIEDRHPAEQGGYESDPILGISLSDEDGAVWNTLKLPANLAIVGTVNMDESTLGFSRKVLDRAFTIELSDVDLPNWGLGAEPRIAELGWPVENWYPRAIRLSGLATRSEAERTIINEVIEALSELNAILVQAQLQVGYRTRDEVVLFVLHAQDVRSSFVTHQGEPVDPLDLALHMKILPRLAGGSSPLKHAIARLLGWAYDGSAAKGEADITNLVETWGSAGCPSRLAGARYPLTAARLCLMLGRLRDEGFTSFWL